MRVLHSNDEQLNAFYDACNLLESTFFQYFVPTYKNIFAQNPVADVTNHELMQICNVKARGLANYLMANPPDYDDNITSPETKALLRKDWEEDVEEEADWCLGDGSYMANQMRRIVLPALRIKYLTIDKVSDDSDYKSEVKEIAKRLKTK